MCVFTLPDNFDRRCPDYEDDISAEEEKNYLLNCFKLKAKELRATASCGLFFSYLPGKRGVF